MANIAKPPLNEAVMELLQQGGLRLEATKKGGLKIRLDGEVEHELRKREEPKSFAMAIARRLDEQDELVRLAFESDPSASKYHGVYKQKLRLTPDNILKRIVIQDDLVAAIVQTRENQMSAFGRPRPDRFSTGFVVEPRQSTLEAIEKLPEQEKRARKEELQKRVAVVIKQLMSCGDDSLDISGYQDKLSLPQYILMTVRNAIVLGRSATEVLWKENHTTGQKQFVGFRVIDAGTIYRAEPQQGAAEAVRRQAYVLLSQLNNKKIQPERFMRDEYAWIQVINDRPVQAFTDQECLVHNFYPVPDYELDGYPVTPLDTVMSAVTTHINITTHNKLYFQSGRAARGMIVIKSDDIDESVVSRVRQQFMAQINSVNNAWRMPVFGVGSDDEITWQTIDSGGRDMEFQYLSDMNARTILAAFQMSPEELTGFAYLSRGTNNQALSESNNEYRLEAARDVGIRPLLAQLEDFFNQSILPLFDKTLAETCVLRFVGLDAETAEKESVRLQQDMPVHMTYDEVLEKVEKKAIGKRLGGEYPLNPQFQAVLDKFIPVGVQLEELFGIEGASKDPQYAYLRDPFWFQWQQLQMQAQQAAAQQQAQAQQAAMGGPPPGGDDGGGGGAPQDDTGQGEAAKPTQEQSQTEGQKSQAAEEASASPGGDLSTSVDQAMGALSKAEKQLPPSKRKLVVQQKMLLADFLKSWEDDMREATRDIVGIAGRAKPRAKG